jgi:cbb3-type cytochrome oxidase subunit 3
MPLLDASVVFGMLYFVLSSAVCTVWFRFVWLAVTWHCMRDVSRREALEERRQFILLLDSAFEGATQKNVPLCAVAQIVSCVWPSLTARQSLKALHQCFSSGNGPRIENVPREHLGALAWFLHADARVGVPLPSWMSCYFSRPVEQSNTGEKSLPLPLSYFLHFCAVLSFSTLIASAWLPDPGDRCNSYNEGVHIPPDMFRSRDTECGVNRGLEWLDVLICACFCVELGWIFMLQGRAAVARVCNVYRILQVTTEVLMILTLFRDQGMGNKAIILRLIRTPRLVFIIQSWSVFNYWLQFSITTLVAAAQIFVTSLVFIFFFGAVTWKAVVFSGARCAINLFSKVYIV